MQHGTRSYVSISAVDAGAQQQTLLSIDGTDGRTDSRPLCYMDTALHYASNVNRPNPSLFTDVVLGNFSVPIQLAQCWFPRLSGLAISNAKI